MNAVLNEQDQDLTSLLIVRDTDGRVAITIGLFITVFFVDQLTRRVREAVAEVADEYITRLDAHLRWGLSLTMNRYYPVRSKRVRRPRGWLPDHPDGAPWEFEFHGGATTDAASAFKVEGYGSRTYHDGGLGYFHLALPLLWFSEHPGSLLDEALAICNRLHPISGNAGIGVLEPSDGFAANKFQSVVRSFAERFPGLDIGDPIADRSSLREGIKGANWLTIIGDRWLEELGGAGHVDAQLPDGLTLTPYSGGAILQAGPRPEIGDVTMNRWPRHYIAAAKLLKKVQTTKHRGFHFGGEGHMTQESSLAWLFRFDGR